MNRITRIAALTGMFLVLALGAASADADDSRWRARLTANHTEPTGIDELDGELGFGLGLEYKASRRIGLALDVIASEVGSDDLDEDDVGTGPGAELTYRSTPILAGVNFHLTPNRRADFYLGPVLAYVPSSEIDLEFRDFPPGPILGSSLIVETESEIAWGARIGVDVALGSGRSFFTAGATYLASDVSIEEDGDEESTSLDPLVVQVGFGVRF